MYKFLLFVVGLLLCGTVKAQEYDETKLLGTWDVVDLNGPMSPVIESFESIVLGDYDLSGTFYSGKLFGESLYNYYNVIDFFISNGNKLHLSCDIYGRGSDYSLRFIIKDFTDNEIKLTTYDGKTSFSLRRDLESGAKSIKTEESSTGKEYYNLNGVRLNSPEPGIVITKENNEVRKEIFK